MSTRVQIDSRWDITRKASYEDYFDNYFWGFEGHPTVNLQKVCVDQKPYGFRRLKTGEDVVLTMITLGVYTPSTVQVWCGD